jgi:translation initiation factor eIF-2B subunit epsilon
MDTESNQILYFDDSISKKAASVPIQIMKNPDSESRSHLSVQFRSDLLDCHIDICSPEVLLQFADNFDYHDIRKQFIHNEVVNWELGMHIFGYVLQNEYAARVHEPRSYHAVCQDIINRWVSPLVPDSVLLPDSSCTHIGRYVYKENNVRISRSAKIGPGVVIGRGAIIDDFVEISDSVIGRDCKIRANTIVKDSHIWARSEIQENSKVHSSIICEDVVVKKSAIVPRGCILSQGVVIGESVALLEYTRLSLHPNRLESCTDLPTSQDYDFSVVGPDGKGFVYSLDSTADSTIDEDDDIEGDRTEEQIDSFIAASIGCSEEESWKKNLWVLLLNIFLLFIFFPMFLMFLMFLM